MKKQRSGGGGCLCAPFRALSRACDSACNLYVRGMSGCARHVPSSGAVGRGGYARSPSSMVLRTSSDRAEDLVRAAAMHSRRVAPVEAALTPGGKTPERKAGAAAMETIAEDAPCEFGACAWPTPPRTRGVAAGGVTARTSAFGGVKLGSVSSRAKHDVEVLVVPVYN